MEVFLTRIQLGDRQLFQAFCNDITVRKSAEAELRESEARLRESEERFRTAFRLSPLNITILRLSDAKFVEANDAFVRWLVLDRDRIVGHDSRELENSQSSTPCKNGRQPTVRASRRSSAPSETA